MEAKKKYNKRKKVPRISTEVTKEQADAYYNKCEQVFGLSRQGHIPIRKFIHDFTKGRIYIVNGELVLKEKK